MARIIVTSSDNSLPYANGQREALAQEFANKRYENELKRDKPDFEKWKQAVGMADSLTNSKAIGALASGAKSVVGGIADWGQGISDQIDLDRLNNPQAMEALSQAASQQGNAGRTTEGDGDTSGAPAQMSSIGRDISKEPMVNAPGSAGPSVQGYSRDMDINGRKYEDASGYHDALMTLADKLQNSNDPQEVAQLQDQIKQLKAGQMTPATAKDRGSFQAHQRYAGLDMPATSAMRISHGEADNLVGQGMDRDTQDALAKAAAQRAGVQNNFDQSQDRYLRDRSGTPQTPEAQAQLDQLQSDQNAPRSNWKQKAVVNKKQEVFAKLNSALNKLNPHDPKYDEKVHKINLVLHQLETPQSPAELKVQQERQAQIDALQGNNGTMPTESQYRIDQAGANAAGNAVAGSMGGVPSVQMPHSRTPQASSQQGNARTIPNPMKASDPNAMAAFGPDGHGGYIAPPAGAQVDYGEGSASEWKGPHTQNQQPASQTQQQMPDNRFVQNKQTGKWEMAPKAQKMTPAEIILAARMAHTPEQQKAVMKAAAEADVPFSTLGELLTGTHKLKFAEAVAKHIPKERNGKSPEEIASTRMLNEAKAAKLWQEANHYADKLELQGKQAEAQTVRANAYGRAVSLDETFRPQEVAIKRTAAGAAASQASTASRAETAKEKADYYTHPEGSGNTEPPAIKSSRNKVDAADKAEIRLEEEAGAPIGQRPDPDDDPKGATAWDNAKRRKDKAKVGLAKLKAANEPGGKTYEHRKAVYRHEAEVKAKHDKTPHEPIGGPGFMTNTEPAKAPEKRKPKSAKPAY